MIEDLRIFSKSLYSNKDIYETRHFKIGYAILTILIVSIISNFPFFYGLASRTPEEIVSNFPGIYETFDEIYEMDESCAVDNLKMECRDDMDGMVIGDYTLFTTLPDELPDQYIYFGEDEAQIGYVDRVNDRDFEYKVYGSYYSLDGVDLSNIDSELSSNETTDAIIHSIYLSLVPSSMGQILLIGASQLIVWVVVMAALLLVSNRAGLPYQLRFWESFKVVSFAGISPALAAAFLSFIAPSFAGVSFMVFYAARIVFIYMNRVLKKNLKKDIK
jgi:hypothetical protein